MSDSSFSHEVDDGRVTLRGDLDETTTFLMRSLLDDLSDGFSRDLTIDLSGVDLLPSAAVGVLATTQATARRQGATLEFVATDGSMAARVLTICGLDYSTS